MTIIITTARKGTYFLLEKECYCSVSALRCIPVFLLSQQIQPENIQDKQDSVFTVVLGQIVQVDYTSQTYNN